MSQQLPVFAAALGWFDEPEVPAAPRKSLAPRGENESYKDYFARLGSDRLCRNVIEDECPAAVYLGFRRRAE
jgi:hypothetical protein